MSPAILLGQQLVLRVMEGDGQAGFSPRASVPLGGGHQWLPLPAMVSSDKREPATRLGKAQSKGMQPRGSFPFPLLQPPHVRLLGELLSAAHPEQTARPSSSHSLEPLGSKVPLRQPSQGCAGAGLPLPPSQVEGTHPKFHPGC